MLVRDEVTMLGAEPAWDIAKLFPAQGAWSEEEYLALPGNRLVEYSHGLVEVLSMPSYAHQLIVVLIYRLLHAYLSEGNGGIVLVAPMRVRLWSGKYREPDIVFMLAANRYRIQQQYWEGADLVMEVVSPDDPMRDLDTKRREYAQGGIREYWLVNPIDEAITVFSLPEGQQTYEVHGVFSRGATADSILLPGFVVDVDACFDEAKQ